LWAANQLRVLLHRRGTGIAHIEFVHTNTFSADAVRACLARALPPISQSTGLPRGLEEASTHEGLLRRSHPSVIPDHVLVTTDGSPLSSRAVPVARAAIRACDSGQLTLLRVLTQQGEGLHPVQALEWELARAHAEADLRQMAGQFGSLVGRVDQVVAEGRAAEQILRFADAGEVDLVVMAAHGTDESRAWRMGSVARKVINSGRSSVLIVPTNGEFEGIDRVLLPLDSSPRAECVLPLASRIADAHDATIVLVHVVPRPEIPHRLPAGARDRELIDELTRRSSRRAEAYLHSVRERLVSRGARVEVELLVDDHPARAIEQFAISSGVDLVLLSAHGSSACEREAYGSLARRLLDTLVKPLWIVQDLPQTLAQDQPSSGVHS
jgi:nucleotide-binding universal stress UspA family protein